MGSIYTINLRSLYVKTYVCVCVSACVLWECVCVRDCVHALTQFEYAIYVIIHEAAIIRWAVMFMLLEIFSESFYKIIYAGEK